MLWTFPCSNNTNGISISDYYYYGEDSFNHIKNNIIRDNTNIGLVLSDTEFNEVYQNNISGNTIGICIYGNGKHLSKNNTIQFNNIFNNSLFGIEMDIESNDIMRHYYNFSHNWWGHESGPYHVKDNPNGKGDNISGLMQFSPWISSDSSVVVPVPDDDDDSATPSPPVIGAGLIALSLVCVIGLSHFREDIRFILLSLLALPLYTKLEKDDILGQTNRQDIYSYIVNKPGSNLTKLHKELPIGYGTLVHHLKILEREKHIRSKKDMGRKMFFPKGNDWVRQPTDETIQIDTEGSGAEAGVGGKAGAGETLSSVPVGLKIIEFLKENGPSTMKEIEEGLNLKQTTVSYNIRKLEEGGKVEGTGGKRGAKYRLMDDRREG